MSVGWLAGAGEGHKGARDSVLSSLVPLAQRGGRTTQSTGNSQGCRADPAWKGKTGEIQMLARQRTCVSLELQFAGLQFAATCPRSDKVQEERTSGCLQAKDVSLGK